MEALECKILELERVIRRQEEIINRQNQQMSTFEEQQWQQQHQPGIPNLRPKDIIQEFQHIRPLDDDNRAPSFLRAVDMTMELCGENEKLKEYGLQIVRNNKILGGAANYVRLLPEAMSWSELKQKLLHYFKPTVTYSDVLIGCQSIKVSSLRELFGYFEKAKFAINNIYEFDQLKPQMYRPENVDGYLVSILTEKIEGNLRAHIGGNESLYDIIEKFSRLKILDDLHTIHYKHVKETDTK